MNEQTKFQSQKIRKKRVEKLQLKNKQNDKTTQQKQNKTKKENILIEFMLFSVGWLVGWRIISSKQTKDSFFNLDTRIHIGISYFLKKTKRRKKENIEFD